MNSIADVLLLSRIQFAVTIMFHILFPTLTIGLGLFIVIIESAWLITKDELYFRMCRFWTKVFAINFGIGVVTGIVMEFEFGTNWSRFSAAVANVFSPFLYFEVLTAFFLEAGFLGIMLFGWNRVGKGVHFLATCLVSGGAILSACWIMAANSWMQAPAGYYMEGGKFMVASFTEVLFTRPFLIRTGHMILAAFETSVFAVAGISAFFLLKGKYAGFYRRSMGVALVMAALFAPLQIYIGDVNGRQVFHDQPAKLAAMEGHWETNEATGAPFSVVGIPDMEKEKNLFEITVPDGLSLLVTHTLTGRVAGLKDFPKDERPNSLLVYWSFRIMAGIGFIFLGVMIWAAVLWRRGRLFACRPFLWTMVLIQPSGWLAVEMGWLTAEVGRQPWVVYNMLRTSQGTSPILPGNIVWSLGLFVIIFTAIGGSYFYYIMKALSNGPDLSTPIPHVQKPAGTQAVHQYRNSGEEQ